jgi:hypothetical protein
MEDVNYDLFYRYRDYKCLLASEVVQLLCIVPTFFDYITKDIGLYHWFRDNCN